jgi:hypothetical protein
MAKTLADLVAEKKKLQESELKGAGNSDKKIGPDEDGGTSKPSLGGDVKPVDRGEGAKDAPKAFEPKNGDMGNTKSVDREAGAAAGVKEVGSGDEKIGNKAAVEGAKPVDRKEGATGAPKDFMSEFRGKVRSALGLPLDSELNQGNKGLNK